jgi:hypothetical protein
MSQELTPMQTFTQKVEEKIRNDIAKMLPDEVIAEMVKKATHSLFFEPIKKEVKDDRYYTSYRTVELPSAFEGIVQEAVKPIIEARVGQLIIENRDKIDAAIEKALADGFGTLAIKFVDDLFRSALQSSSLDMGDSIMTALRNRGIQV